MIKLHRKIHPEVVNLAAAGLFLTLLAGTLVTLAVPVNAQAPAAPTIVPAASPYMDVHTHLDEHDPEGSVQAVVKAMGAENAAKIVFETEPYGPGNPQAWDAEGIFPSAKKYPGKVAVLGGGGSLNTMLMEAVKSGDAGPEVQRKFKEHAEELLREGAVGFGELTTEHLSLPSSPIKDYEYAPADHPLLFILADIAAAHRVPIDLHMEAVPQTMPLPPGLQSPPNPPMLHANIAAFERLLRHNPRANIIWAHAGGDFTGFRTPDLCRRLLAAHPNLYMEIKVDPVNLGKNPVISADGKLKPEWLKLFEDFPNQFVIGSDQHYGAKPLMGRERWQAVVLVFNQLPAGLRQKIGVENALRLYPNALTSSAARP